jgi:hypothetical protein
MKVKAPLIAAMLLGVTAISNAFSLDFTGFEGQSIGNITIPVAGYGDVVVIKAGYPASTVDSGGEVSFNAGDKFIFVFTAATPTAGSVIFETLTAGSVTVTGEGTNSREITFASSGTINGLTFDAAAVVPEPTSAFLGILGSTLLVVRRRR